jgi:uncharacterized protein (TIGR03437 family)
MVKRILALLAISASAIFAQSPVVTEILNNYGLSNSPTVAQGAIFIVKGSNLSDFTTVLQEVPLQTNLQNVRMAITVNGVTTFAPMYYVLPQQLAGILPSSTPVGNGTLQIRNNGKNSSPIPINVIRSGFGVLTVSGTGSGSARVQDANQGYQELLSTRSTNPGNFLVFYGSGVGPVTGDETIGQVQTDLTGIPISVTIGGKPAEVFYRGRTAFPGLDQINVKVPTLDAGSYGCSVPVVIVTNGVPANATTIPVSPSGPNCSSGGATGGPVSGATQQEIERWTAAGTFTSGNIRLGRTTLYSVADSLPGLAGGTTITKSDAFTASFSRISGAGLGPYLRGDGAVPEVGSCLVGRGQTLDLTTVALDAGASITATGPGGTQVAERNGSAYSARLSGLVLNAGRYTFAGVGGTGVGAFTGNVDVGGEFVVTNPDDFKLLIRDAGAAVRWTGGDPSVPVQISGISVAVNPDGTLQSAAAFLCLANGADGRFTVPASILSQLPASATFSGAGLNVLLRGSFSVTGFGKGTRITASGMDYLVANNSWTWTVTTDYR